MNIKNIKKLDDNKFEIRFSYIDQLTGKRRRVRRRVEGTVADAIENRDRLKQKASNGNLNGSSNCSERSLSDWYPDFLEHKRSKGLRASSIRSIEHALKGVLNTEAGEWRPEHIQAHHIDQWVSDRLRETDLSPATINKRLGYLKRLIKFARKRLGRGAGFLRDVASVKGSTRRKGRALTPKQAQRFLAGIKTDYPQHYAVCFVLLISGQRFGAVTALRWHDIDDDWITFSRSQYRGAVEYGSKSGNVIRLPITDRIGEVLDWNRRWMLDNEHPNSDHPDGLIFPTAKPVAESSTDGYRVAGDLRHAFQKVCDRVDIPKVTPHDLRRTFNSWASERVSGTVLRSITGHSSSSMTDHYYHGSREAKSEVVTSITKLVGQKA